MSIVNTESHGKHWLRVRPYPCPIQGKSKRLFDLSALSNEIPEIDCPSTKDKSEDLKPSTAIKSGNPFNSPSGTLEAKGKEKKMSYETD